MSVNALNYGAFLYTTAFSPLLRKAGKQRKVATLDPTRELNHFLADVEKRAFTMARFSTGNADDAFDLVQDAMLDFVRRYAGRPAAEWPVLFYRILHSRTTDWYRRTAVRNRFRHWFGKNSEDKEGDDPIQSLPDTNSPDAAQIMMRKDIAAALEKALRLLPQRQRQAFLLRAWEGFDVAQTASAMGCSQGSVKTHYSRAVHALRALLEEHKP